MKILIVGDRPSKLNKDPDVAFVGARCHKRLMEWIKFLQLDVDSYYLLNSHTPELMDKIDKLSQKGYKVVALGVNASNRLKKRQIDHYQMEHPSGLNRKLNHKTYEQSKLRDLKKYLFC